jgi:hypothetical protein
MFGTVFKLDKVVTDAVSVMSYESMSPTRASESMSHDSAIANFV